MNHHTDPTTSTASAFRAWIDDFGLADLFARMDIAEEEITASRLRHPGASDRLYHAFTLLHTDLERMANEQVYRAHCRELLDRVITGDDTRPGTAAEICCMMLETSLTAPLTSTAFALYQRMWIKAGLPELPELAEDHAHREALDSAAIDDHEQWARRKLTVPDRTLDSIECRGLHHGELVNCTFVPAPTIFDSVGEGPSHEQAP